ncbi:MAG: asparagine synthase (glutamine-hydrolyzing) [Candidatus Limnocylindria bacterium]
MCGIAGIVGAEGNDAVRQVRQMLERLTHRGPDDEGIEQARGAVLGARRLSIIDLSHGHQPMSNEDGRILAVQNGEIYNFRDLRAELRDRGHTFRTDNDTEILPHAYEEYGDGFVERLRGMFALAVWDGRNGRLVIARDRMGKKPLVYARWDQAFVFASEIQALLSLPLDRAVDEAAIGQYLTLGYVPAPRTGFIHINKLRPAHLLTFADGRIDLERRYWRLSFEPKVAISEVDAVERLRTELNDAVRVRMVSDVPLGAFLSGGLDSSAVVAFMAANAPHVRTFSIGFSEADFDELRYARLVATRFSTQHQEYIVEPSALDVLPMLVKHLGEPFADSSIIPTYYVAKTARQEVTVALNGDGGDELFGGYDRYRAARFAALFDHLPFGISSLIGRTAEHLVPQASSTPRFVRRARRFGSLLRMSPDARYLALIGYFSDHSGIHGDRVRVGSGGVAVWEAALAEALPKDDVERLLAIDMRTYLPGDLLVKMDIATMAASLEARSPFLDHKLIEFVAHLPAQFKLRRGRSKYLLRRLMEGMLPAQVIDRPKMGFGVPVGRWMRGPLRPLLEDALLGSSDRGFLHRAEVRRLVREHLAGTADHTYRLWALLMLELWFAHVVEQRSEPLSGARAG